jgi:hypothetical protein
MKIFPPALEIGDEEGFSADKDIFQRKGFGAGLKNLVSVAADPLVIALDAPWGSGKTTFIKMWAGDLRKTGFPVVYFDAFENDHVDNAFLAIAAEVIGLSNSLKNTKSPAHKKFLKKAGRAWPAPGSEDIELGVFMGPEVDHGEAEVHARVQA